MEFEAAGASYTALWWNRGDLANELEPGRRLSAAFALEADNFAGNGAVQLVLKDLCEED